MLSLFVLLQPPLLPTPQPFVHLAMSYHSSNFNRNRGHYYGNQHPNNNCYNHQNRFQFAADWRPNNWQQNRRNTGAGQWSGQQNVRRQLCSNSSHTSPYYPQFHGNPPWLFAHLIVGNISVATFNPIIKQATFRLVFSIAVLCDWKIHQLDIHNAFLNDVINEEVYMKQPSGFVDSTLPSYVCRLHKSLYGLKQASQAWYTHLNDLLLSIEFCTCKRDASLFIFFIGTDICYLFVYVDDILLMSSNSLLLKHLIQLLSLKFKLRDLGTVHYFLGIDIQSTSMSVMVRQHKYTLDILTRAGMISYKPCSYSFLGPICWRWCVSLLN